MSYVTINVTRACIDKGQPCNSRKCAIAWAARKAGVKAPSVDGNYLWYGRGRGRYGLRPGVLLPAKARRFVERFDAEQPVKPFSFRVKLP